MRFSRAYAMPKSMPASDTPATPATMPIVIFSFCISSLVTDTFPDWGVLPSCVTMLLPSREPYDDAPVRIDSHRGDAGTVESVLPVISGISFVTLISFIAGRFHTKRRPGHAVVIGDVP